MTCLVITVDPQVELWTEDTSDPAETLVELAEPPLHHRLAVVRMGSVRIAYWVGSGRDTEPNPRATAVTAELGPAVAVTGIAVVGPLTGEELAVVTEAAAEAVIPPSTEEP